MNLNRRGAAFTLIELLLVCAILTIVAGAMAPRMSRAFRSLNLKSAVQEFVEAMDVASRYAIRHRVETRLMFEQNGGVYWFEADDPESSSARLGPISSGPLGDKREMPRGILVEGQEGTDSTNSGETRFLRFRPDGGRSAGLVKISRGTDRARWIRIGAGLGENEILTVDPDETSQ